MYYYINVTLHMSLLSDHRTIHSINDSFWDMGSKQRAWVICKNNILNQGDGNIKTNNLLECFYLKESVRPFSIIACSVILIAVKLE